MGYQVNDRVSFQRFLGLTVADTVPDVKTIWLLREHLGENGCEELFQVVGRAVDEAGLVTHTGSIIGATFVDAPASDTPARRTLLSRMGVSPRGGTPRTRRRRRHKDVDARWVTKGDETHFGGTDHVNTNTDSTLIVRHTVTPANVHDSTEFAALVGHRGQQVWADAGYVGDGLRVEVQWDHLGVRLHGCEKGIRGYPVFDV